MGVSVEVTAEKHILFDTVCQEDVKGGYSAYLENGGILSQSVFNEFQALKSVPDSKNASCRASINQALNMARFSEIELSPQEVTAYALFRQKMREGNAVSQNSINSQRIDVWSLSDQRLLAEIFLMEGSKEAYIKFTSSYPKIFDNK